MNKLKKIAFGVAAAGLLLTNALPAFAAANPHASCIGLHGSAEGPEGVIGTEVKTIVHLLKGSGASLGTFVSEEAQLHLGSPEACPE